MTRGVPNDPEKRAEQIRKLSLYCGEKHGQYGTHRTKETKEKLSKKLKGKPAWNKGKKSPWLSESNKKWVGKMNANFGGQNHTYERTMKVIETKIGGFWYGNVRYKNPSIYCNLWKQLRDDGRIGACWDFKSVLSGETEDLVYHHIYYQKKACCTWDEDVQGYYAIINIGTLNRPKPFKYYIDGDPNKFVPLTRAENSMVNSNQLKWIKFFEEIINKNGGKCYLTKPEMKEYIKNKGGIQVRIDGWGVNGRKRMKIKGAPPQKKEGRKK